MKYLVITYLLLKYSCWVFCQTQKLDCVLLQKSLENRVFNQYFLIDKFPNQTLIIIDSSDIFQHCKISNVFNRKVEIMQALSLKKSNHEIIIDYIRGHSKNNLPISTDGLIQTSHFSNAGFLCKKGSRSFISFSESLMPF